MTDNDSAKMTTSKVVIQGFAGSEDVQQRQLMKRAIDSARSRSIYSPTIATVEPVFSNLRHNSRACTACEDDPGWQNARNALAGAKQEDRSPQCSARRHQ